MSDLTSKGEFVDRQWYGILLPTLIVCSSYINMFTHIGIESSDLNRLESYFMKKNHAWASQRRQCLVLFLLL